MADEPLEGLTALLARMKGLPIRLQDKILSDWTTVTARRMAARLREVVRVKAFRSGRTLGSIRGARVRPVGLPTPQASFWSSLFSVCCAWVTCFIFVLSSDSSCLRRRER
mgnify:CR=1 FL=1